MAAVRLSPLLRPPPLSPQRGSRPHPQRPCAKDFCPLLILSDCLRLIRCDSVCFYCKFPSVLHPGSDRRYSRKGKRDGSHNRQLQLRIRERTGTDVTDERDEKAVTGRARDEIARLFHMKFRCCRRCTRHLAAACD